MDASRPPRNASVIGSIPIEGYIRRTIRPVLGTVIRKLGPDRQNPASLVHGRVAVDQFAGGTVDVIDAATHSGHVAQDEGL